MTFIIKDPPPVIADRREADEGAKETPPLSEWIEAADGSQRFESRICLLPMIRPESAAVLRMFGYLERGFLPASGGMADQPNALISAFDLIRRVIRRANAQGEG